jgi:hypothetical protein
MSSAVYEPVATTEELSSTSPTRPRKYWVTAVVLFVGLLVGLASFYKFGIWNLPSARVEPSRPTPSNTLATPSQSDIKEQNNKTGTETQVVMPHGKYSVG